MPARLAGFSSCCGVSPANVLSAGSGSRMPDIRNRDTMPAAVFQAAELTRPVSRPAGLIEPTSDTVRFTDGANSPLAPAAWPAR